MQSSSKEGLFQGITTIRKFKQECFFEVAFLWPSYFTCGLELYRAESHLGIGWRCRGLELLTQSPHLTRSPSDGEALAEGAPAGGNYLASYWVGGIALCVISGKELVHSRGQKGVPIPPSILDKSVGFGTSLCFFLYLRIWVITVFASNNCEVSLNMIMHMRCIQQNTGYYLESAKMWACRYHLYVPGGTCYAGFHLWEARVCLI